MPGRARDQRKAFLGWVPLALGLTLLLHSTLAPTAWAALAGLTFSLDAYDSTGNVTPDQTMSFAEVWPGHDGLLSPGVTFHVASDLEWEMKAWLGDAPSGCQLAQRPVGGGSWTPLSATPAALLAAQLDTGGLTLDLDQEARLSVDWTLDPGLYLVPVTYVATFTDRTPPVGSVSIDGGTTYATSLDVTLELDATDEASGVDAFRVSEDNFAWGNWQELSPPAWVGLTLTDGPDGERAVYVCFRDRAGNETDPLASPIFDTIWLDRGFPTITGVAAINRGSASAEITWQTLDEAASSQVDYGLTAGYGETTPLDPAPLTDHLVSLSGLDPGALYHYRVRSSDPAGNESTAGDLTFYTFCEAPLNLTGVSRRHGSTTYFDLTWDAVARAAGYRVWRRDVQTGGPYVLIDSTAATTSTDALPGTLPYDLEYYVCAVNAGGDVSAPSNTVEAVGTDQPAVISDVVAEPSTTSCLVTWTTDKPATSQVRYGTSSGHYSFSTPQDPTQVTDHAVTLTALETGTLYYFQVLSVDTAGHWSYSDEYQFTTLTAPVPEPPQNLRAFEIAGHKVRLEWDASALATGYRIYSKDLLVPGSVFTLLQDTTDTFYIDGRYGTHGPYSYEYYVVAYNAQGVSGESNHVTYDMN